MPFHDVVRFTPEWGRQRLKQQDNQSAIYAFTGKFDYDLGITVRYGAGQTYAWGGIVTRLETERAKILARSSKRASDRHDDSQRLLQSGSGAAYFSNR